MKDKLLRIDDNIYILIQEVAKKYSIPESAAINLLLVNGLEALGFKVQN